MHEISIPKDQIVWEADSPFETANLIKVLRDRGWHLTDIADELDEARRTS
jgi:hypothetical protein